MQSVLKYDTGGIHVIADFYGIKDIVSLDDESVLRVLITKAIEVSKATLVEMYTKKFHPQGVTLSAIISESSCDLHTYPEHGYMSISFYTCGDKANPLDGIKYLRDIFNPEHINVMSIGRGTKNSMDLKIIHNL